MTYENYKRAIIEGKLHYRVVCKNGRILYTLCASDEHCQKRFTGLQFFERVTETEFFKFKNFYYDK